MNDVVLPEEAAYVARTASSDADPIHLWFELSYARYLTLPRVTLQSMPVEWQIRFVRCLEELEAAFEHRPEYKSGVDYTVSCRDPWTKKFVADPWPNYDRGRAYIEPNAWREDDREQQTDQTSEPEDQ